MKSLLSGMLATAVLAMTSCSAGPGGSGLAPSSVLASEKDRVVPVVPESDLEELVDGNIAFGFDLYRFLAGQRADDNLFYSPYSISLALAMTYAGAHGETEAQMAKALRYTLSQERLHPAFNGLDQALAERGEGAEGRDGEGFRLNIANAIWGQQDYAFLEGFLDTLAIDYGAGLRVLDFVGAPEDCRVTINDWVSEETEGKIEDLLPRGTIDPLTRLILTNAIYFNAAWAYPFEEEATHEGPFTRFDGTQIMVPLMHQNESFGYAEGDNYQALELPYDGGEMSMIILLPERDEFEAFEGSLDGERVQRIIEEVSYRQVAVTMPSFEFESKFNLNQALAALGMPTAFSDRADFSGMTGDRDLYISEVLHNAFVSVDEEGTEAAAATAVVMKLGAMTEQPIEVLLDHPFIFLIRDVESGAVLFVGRVLDPTA